MVGRLTSFRGEGGGVQRSRPVGGRCWKYLSGDLQSSILGTRNGIGTASFRSATPLSYTRPINALQYLFFSGFFYFYFVCDWEATFSCHFHSRNLVFQVESLHFICYAFPSSASLFFYSFSINSFLISFLFLFFSFCVNGNCFVLLIHYVFFLNQFSTVILFLLLFVDNVNNQLIINRICVINFI